MKISKGFLVMLPMAVLLSGCTLNYKQEYKKLRNSDQRVYQNLKEIIDAKIEMGSLTPECQDPKGNVTTNGKPAAGYLRDTSPLFLLPDENVSRFSFYKFNVGEKQELFISMRAICSCWGTKKSIINPKFIIFNKDLSWKEEFHWDFVPDQYVRNTVVRLIAEKVVRPPKAGTYYLIAYGDNSKEGQFLMTEVGSKVTAPGLITNFNVNSSPVGQYELEVISKDLSLPQSAK